ncbi:MAG: exodeoxyribonuclease VII small subunit [Bacilli bacterium]|jgi:exodeoxyribonuclease VII small subunit
MAKTEAKFEEKITELEKIINELENGEIDLDESINKYMMAMKLVKECDEKLKNIEEQVNKMVLENGEVKDFELED